MNIVNNKELQKIVHNNIAMRLTVACTSLIILFGAINFILYSNGEENSESPLQKIFYVLLTASFIIFVTMSFISPNFSAQRNH